MRQTATTSRSDEVPNEAIPEYSLVEVSAADPRERQVAGLRLLWSKRRFFLRGVGAGLVISTLIAFLIPQSYVSTAQLMPPDQQSAATSGMAMMAAMASKISGGLGAAGGGLGSIAGDLLGIKTSGALFMGVLRSQTAQDRLVNQFDLRKVYHKRYMKDARAKLDENTSISEDRKSGIITIAVTDHDPQRAAAIANAYVQVLNSLIAELSTSSARREREFLETRLKVVKQNVDDAADQLAQFSSKSGTLEIQQEGKAMLDIAANLGGQLIAAQSQLEGLRQIYTDNNSRVVALKGRVAALQREMAKLSGTGKVALAGEAATDSSSDSAIGMPSIRNLPLLGAKYADYYRNAKIQETVFELLTQQYELAKVQEAKEIPSVKVLDPGMVPEQRSFPPRGIVVFVGTTLALIGCVVWVWGRERWKDVDPQDPRKILLEETVERLRTRVRQLSHRGELAN